MLETLQLKFVSKKKEVQTSQTSSKLKASFIVSHEISKSNRPFTEGEFVKLCSVKMLNTLGFEDAANAVENVSLSRHSVTRRAISINEQSEEKLKQIISECSYFSIALDESTDVSDTSQMLIFIRCINDK